MTERAIVWSFGGGTQSDALALLIDQGRLPVPDVVIMADTGREKAKTWRYTEQYVLPLLARWGRTLHIARHDLATVDLYSKKDHDLLIPAWTPTGGQLPTYCSVEWKARVIRRYLTRVLGYGPARPVVTWLGMSLDEVGRMKPGPLAWQTHAWPLIFDVPKTRGECRQIILDAGWPEPPKSACWMCPYTTNAEWGRMQREDPGDFAQAVAFDQAIRHEDPAVFVHRSGMALAEADLTAPDAPPLPLFGEMAGCDSGYCYV